MAMYGIVDTGDDITISLEGIKAFQRIAVKACKTEEEGVQT